MFGIGRFDAKQTRFGKCVWTVNFRCFGAWTPPAGVTYFDGDGLWPRFGPPGAQEAPLTGPQEGSRHICFANFWDFANF